MQLDRERKRYRDHKTPISMKEERWRDTEKDRRIGGGEEQIQREVYRVMEG
jgi:hypothetical protein